jgi:Fur family peroxide stress response transcriptional regulator
LTKLRLRIILIALVKGQKLTPQREAVYEVIREREDHPTASDIFEAARKRLPGISSATVYN